MMTDTETPETNPTKVRWTATAAGYAFVLAMGAMAMWMAPSPASVEVQKSSAMATAPFTAFAGSGSGRVVLGQPEGNQVANGASSHREMSSLDHTSLNNPDLMPVSNPPPMAVAAYNYR
jgi:hypothetical protein